MTPLPYAIREPGDVRVLIACETSNRATQAFLDLGFDALSCDLLPSEVGSNRHITEDARVVLDEYGPWDMLVAHVPCTRLCNSGVRWLHKPPKGRTLEEMWAELDEGCALFSDMLNADVPHVAVENPQSHKYAKERIRNYVKPQFVQPYWFGDPWSKLTGLSLRNLPELKPTNKLEKPEKGSDEWKKWQAIHMASPGPDRWRFRSRTPEGLARAMADQWGSYILSLPAAEDS